MRRTTLALAAVLSLAGSRALMAQADVPDSAAAAPMDSLTVTEPTDSTIDTPDREHRQQAQREERAHRKNRLNRGARDGNRRGGGEVRARRPESGGRIRTRRPEGGGEVPRLPHGDSDRPKPNS
ncbi:MAG: hypothetical protein ABI587_10255 [Gemmatimonadales bacterium]